MSGLRVESLEGRIIGARIVGVNATDANRVELHFEHKGTDDDSGFIVVPLTGIYFTDGFAADGGEGT